MSFGQSLCSSQPGERLTRDRWAANAAEFERLTIAQIMGDRDFAPRISPTDADAPVAASAGGSIIDDVPLAIRLHARNTVKRLTAIVVNGVAVEPRAIG